MIPIPEDGGPAFPFGVRVDHHDTYGGGHRIEKTNEPSMSLRDWFAGQLIGSMIYDERNDNRRFLTIAKEAYAMADAMLEARQLP